jgi:hypothetical protein
VKSVVSNLYQSKCVGHTRSVCWTHPFHELLRFLQAKTTLGWATTSTLEQDLGWYYDSYKAAGLEGKDMVFEADELALGAAK